MRIRHPREVSHGEAPGVALDVDGTHVAPDDDGHYALPDGSQSWLERYADANGVDVDALLVENGPDTLEPGDTACSCAVGDACDECGGKCSTVQTDGDVCGRERPCRYHDIAKD